MHLQHIPLCKVATNLYPNGNRRMSGRTHNNAVWEKFKFQTLSPHRRQRLQHLYACELSQFPRIEHSASYAQ
ncbi:hypothetical protein PRUPE_1G350200 [Prunus persica]|uniref:Uncharacterized protein n=1 Tax=Prunus persica TaxID=3760 RepID=A0A251R8R7_PRUPE|nr:hypothetical protein PRUPE_1G350200 [Prunus persica]